MALLNFLSSSGASLGLNTVIIIIDITESRVSLGRMFGNVGMSVISVSCVLDMVTVRISPLK